MNENEIWESAVKTHLNNKYKHRQYFLSLGYCPLHGQYRVLFLYKKDKVGVFKDIHDIAPTQLDL